MPPESTRSCTTDSLETVIARYGGVLVSGAHSDHKACCVLEARSVCLGVPWTDEPDALGMPDIRPLNDATWSSDATRTAAMVRLAAAYDGWATWTPARRLAVVTQIAIETVRQIIAEFSGFPHAIRKQCQQVDSLPLAAAAAEAAAELAVGAETLAAHAAAGAARAAALAARKTAGAEAAQAAWAAEWAATEAARAAEWAAAGAATEEAEAARAARAASRAASWAARAVAGAETGAETKTKTAKTGLADHVLMTAVNLWIGASRKN